MASSGGDDGGGGQPDIRGRRRPIELGHSRKEIPGRQGQHVQVHNKRPPLVSHNGGTFPEDYSRDAIQGHPFIEEGEQLDNRLLALADDTDVERAQPGHSLDRGRTQMRPAGQDHGTREPLLEPRRDLGGAFHRKRHSRDSHVVRPFRGDSADRLVDIEFEVRRVQDGNGVAFLPKDRGEAQQPVRDGLRQSGLQGPPPEY